MGGRVLQTMKRPSVLAAAEVMHPGTACSLGWSSFEMPEIRYGIRVPEGPDVALLTLQHAVSWTVSAPPELSSSLIRRGHPMTR